MIDCPKIIVTQGKHGCVTYERGGIVHTIPAFAKNVVDTVGAGDAFLAVTAPLVAAGGADASGRLHRQCRRRAQGRDRRPPPLDRQAVP